MFIVTEYAALKINQTQSLSSAYGPAHESPALIALSSNEG